MKHIKDEDMGRLIDGNMDQKERKILLEHLSECDTCLKIYSETLTFIEDEEESSGQTHTIENHTSMTLTNTHSKRRITYSIAASILLLIGIGIPFIVKWLSPTPISSTEIAQIKSIENTLIQIENSDVHAFTTTGDKTFATVRTGIFIEDLSCMVNVFSHDKIKTKEIQTRLINALIPQLKTIFEDNLPIFEELRHITSNNAKATLSKIRNLFKSKEQNQLLGFGQFIESQILYTYSSNENPTNRNIENIDDYRRIAQEYTLPEGVIKNLNKLELNQTLTETRETLIKIKEVFLPAVSGDGDIHETEI